MTRMDADVASLRADWSPAYEVTYRPDPADDLPFKAVPRADLGALLEAPASTALGAMIRADHARRVAARPGGLASLTTASLTTAGLRVSGPDPADPDGFCRLVIACHGAKCVLMVSDNADAELWWTPHAAENADPHTAADLAAALLSGEAGARRQCRACRALTPAPTSSRTEGSPDAREPSHQRGSRPRDRQPA